MNRTTSPITTSPAALFSNGAGALDQAFIDLVTHLLLACAQVALWDLQTIGCTSEANLANAQVRGIIGRRWINIDLGNGRLDGEEGSYWSAWFMVDRLTGTIHGTKGYGRAHLGKVYGTLEQFDPNRLRRYWAA